MGNTFTELAGGPASLHQHHSGMSRLSQSLATLAQQQKLAGSLASVVRAEMVAIETARQAGLSYGQICQGLALMGVTSSARTLRHTVYRVQAELRRNARTASAMATATAIAAPVVETAATATATLPPALPETPARPFAPVPATTAAVGVLPDAQALRTEPAEASARTAGPSPGFVRDIVNSAIDLDELARQYRSGAAARRAGSAVSPLASAASRQGALPSQNP